MFSPFEVVLKCTPGLDRAPPGVFATVVPAEALEAHQFDWLTQAEGARAAAMTRPERRAQFAAGRWLLRYAAARVFGESGYRLDFADGRPAVATAGRGPAAVSLSHSGALVLCAAGRVQTLGVDIERIRPRGDWGALCGWTLHPLERERLERAAQPQRWRHFYQAWTYKEALAKALGESVFGFAFDGILVSEEGLLEQVPQDPRLSRPDWRLCPLRVAEGFAAAVAWRA